MAPAPAIPPALPPSVEEAYRRKCIQLKQRIAEVEEANDAARLRLERLKRQVEKMRLERAFLLEQLSKRTSTNVEDSDGSPSPPPTPKEKPLRNKRGHRKPSMLAANESGTPSAAGGPTFIGQNNLRTQSPSSDTFVSRPLDPGPAVPTAFSLYCQDMREAGKEKNKEPEREGDLPDTWLHQGWSNLTGEQQEEYRSRQRPFVEAKEAYDQKQREEKERRVAEYEAARAGLASVRGGSQSGDASGDKNVDKDGGATRDATEERDTQPQRHHARRQDEDEDDREDVEMGNSDTDPETQGERHGE